MTSKMLKETCQVQRFSWHVIKGHNTESEASQRVFSVEGLPNGHSDGSGFGTQDLKSWHKRAKASPYLIDIQDLKICEKVSVEIP